MNAPFRQRDTAAIHGTLHLFAFFHLNIMFSSIEEEQRGDVIRHCYWSLLDLAAEHGPIVDSTGIKRGQPTAVMSRKVLRAPPPATLLEALPVEAAVPSPLLLQATGRATGATILRSATAR